MKTHTKTEAIAHRMKHPRREIQYWVAIQNGNQVGANNSIGILRHQFPGCGVVFKAIR
jgi:hypothetical protein